MAGYYTLESEGPSKGALAVSKVFTYGALLAALCTGALLYNETANESQLNIAPSFIGRSTRVLPSSMFQGYSAGHKSVDIALGAAALDQPLSLDTLSSRVDRPIVIPTGVKITRQDGVLTVQGPKGTLSRPIPDEVKLREENSILLVTYESEERRSKAMFGLYQALIKNMVIGVSQEFMKKMEMIGVGYRARVDGKNLILQVGKSHDVVMPIPDGVKVLVEDNIRLTISGISNEAVGQFCADIRKERPPEPYKGKGIRYLGEKIIMKVGKGGKGKK